MIAAEGQAHLHIYHFGLPKLEIYDGSYFKYTSFTQLSTTPTHELGHGFNLYHTFNGDGGGLYCPIDTNCLTNGDQVCDTPPHKSGDCGAINPCSLIDPFSNSKNNYLSYCPTKIYLPKDKR